MFCIPLHYRGHAGEYRFSALSGSKRSKPCTPPRPRPNTPNPAYCFSEEATNVGFLPTIQRQHMLCIPLHCRGRTGEYKFSALSGHKCSKTCTPPRPRPSTPNSAYCFSEEATNVGFLPTIQRQHMLCIPCIAAGAGEYRMSALSGPKCSKNLYSPVSAAQHPQPCLLLLRRSNDVGFLPTIQRQLMLCIPLHWPYIAAGAAPNVPKPVLPRVPGPAPPTLLPSTPNPAYCFSDQATNVGFLPTIQRQHMLCIPLHCRRRAGEYRFSALSGPMVFQNLYSPASAAQHPQPCLL